MASVVSHSTVPDKVIASIGVEAAKQLYDHIDEVAATKVDRTEYDAHSQIIIQQFETMNKLLDQRFAGIDQRFAGIDQRFAAMNQRFDSMASKADVEKAKVTVVEWVVGAFVAMAGLLLAVLKG